MNQGSAGRWILTSIPALTAVSGFLADWNRTQEGRGGARAARGLSNRQIAASIHISEATVKRHLANLYAKIGVGSRSEATRKALLQGWISALDLTVAEETTAAPNLEDPQE